MDNLNIKGSIEAIKYTGNKIEEIVYQENLVTNKGLDYIAKMIGGDLPGINKLGLGTSNTPPQNTDTKLYNKLILVDVKRDYTIPGSVRFLAKIPENSFSTTVNYLEIGLFYKSTTEEILITRAVFKDAIFQKPENSLTVSYTLNMLRL